MADSTIFTDAELEVRYKVAGDALLVRMREIGLNKVKVRFGRHPTHWHWLCEGEVICPCGGTEYFHSWMINEGFDPFAWADAVASAFKKHIEKDVADGLIPKGWLEAIKQKAPGVTGGQE